MARKRQLELPGLAQKSEPVLRAKRDLNAWEFKRALARHGLQLRGVDHYVDSSGTALILDPVVRRDPVRVHRRATLAKLVRLLRRRA